MTGLIPTWVWNSYSIPEPTSVSGASAPSLPWPSYPPTHAGSLDFFSHAVRSSGFLRMLNMAGGFLIDVLVL